MLHFMGKRRIETFLWKLVKMHLFDLWPWPQKLHWMWHICFKKLHWLLFFILMALSTNICMSKSHCVCISKTTTSFAKVYSFRRYSQFSVICSSYFIVISIIGSAITPLFGHKMIWCYFVCIIWLGKTFFCKFTKWPYLTFDLASWPYTTLQKSPSCCFEF